MKWTPAIHETGKCERIHRSSSYGPGVEKYEGSRADADYAAQGKSKGLQGMALSDTRGQWKQKHDCKNTMGTTTNYLRNGHY